jgi:hypothetical protein
MISKITFDSPVIALREINPAGPTLFPGTSPSSTRLKFRGSMSLDLATASPPRLQRHGIMYDQRHQRHENSIPVDHGRPATAPIATPAPRTTRDPQRRCRCRRGRRQSTCHRRCAPRLAPCCFPSRRIEHHSPQQNGAGNNPTPPISAAPQRYASMIATISMDLGSTITICSPTME